MPKPGSYHRTILVLVDPQVREKGWKLVRASQIVALHKHHSHTVPVIVRKEK